jgi:ABC-type transporter Mla subunit MlaD
MDQQTLLLVFVGISAAALLIQACMLIGIFVVSKKTQSQIAEVLPEVQRVLANTQATVAETRKYVKEIGPKVNTILDSVKAQMARIEEVVFDASDRAKVQLDRAELVLDNTMDKAQSTVNILQRSIVAPIREVYGVLAGLRAALSHLAGASRPSVDHATADEEMFI